ncbi:Nucleolar GTP-binding protein 1 [Cichlidogyrus casuarinus]|uniref:Nucleolar GTP-binding protein 1 n=1 Tax=Cichlidogyrus casuarinus TaxID=1844966 RepID=A0ABD2QLQ6_9PLAT
MPGYNFKSITVVPSSKDFIDIVLSKTQRKTPTEIHKQYAIPRIRAFYMRKVKTCQQYFHEKLEAIVTEFPNVENIHPFYADLINVLYSRDHYKLALSQINTAKNLIDGIGRDQVKMLKYGESLYQCKTLKRTAFGRMCTIIKRQGDNLRFLEETRQHLSRLPSIDTDTRTLILCGFPNVGKSSFINKITRADVDVQPFPFTTKSLFVGHLDHSNLRWQVIDTPGVLDRPLDEHNTIEMISITALAHLHAAVLYVMDLSEQCGYTIEQQIHLFQSLRPLYRNKPVFILANKTDVRTLAELPEESQKMIRELVRLPEEEPSQDELDSSEPRPVFFQMSTFSDQGIMEAKCYACDQLLAMRVQSKLHSLHLGSKEDALANRLYVAMPEKEIENKVFIPPAVIEARRKKAERERMLHEEEADEQQSEAKPLTMWWDEDPDKISYPDMRKHWSLADKDQAYDVVPEFFNGHNIIDFFDPDIEEKLNELEEEERKMEEAGVYEASDWLNDPDLKDPEFIKMRATANKIREARAIRILEMRETKKAHRQPVPRHKKAVDAKEMRKKLADHGLPVDISEEAERGRSKRREALNRSSSRDPSHVKAIERASRSRSRSGVRDDAMAAKAAKLSRLAKRPLAYLAKKGEGDHHIGDLKPKHLYSGKRGTGKTERR